MKKYLAITLGPIIGLLSYAKSTKELALASSFFSDWSKYLVDELDGKLVKETRGLRIMPQSGQENKINNENYPDRIIYELNNADVEDNLKYIDKLKISFLKNKKIFKNNNKLFEKAKKYFQCHGVIYESDEKYALEKAYQILDYIELAQEVSVEKENKLELGQEILEEIKKTITENMEVPSTTEIGLYSIFTNVKYERYREVLKNKIKLDNEDSEEIEEKILQKESINYLQKELDEKKIDEKYRIPKYSKYIAVVQADGDGIGAKLKEYYNNEEKNKYKEMQQYLSQFANDVSKEIKEFGGYPVYIGGDDILCFMPLIGFENKLLIEKLIEIDKNFISRFKQENGISLSFGLSVYYYKYPLEMARQEATRLLFSKAKSYKRINSNDKKHSISMKLIKHSGKTNEITVALEDGEFRSEIINIWKKFLNEQNKCNKLSSVIHRLIENQDIIKITVVYGIQNLGLNETKDLIKNYFINNFNEEIHSEFKTYLNLIKDYIEKIAEKMEGIKIKAEEEQKKDIEELLVQSFGLSYVNFLNVLEIGQFFSEEDKGE